MLEPVTLTCTQKDFDEYRETVEARLAGLEKMGPVPCTQKAFKDYRETVEARLAGLEMVKTNKTPIWILPGIAFAVFMGMNYFAFSGLAEMQGVSSEDIYFGFLVIVLVAMLVCHYASIM